MLRGCREMDSPFLMLRYILNKIARETNRSVENDIYVKNVKLNDCALYNKI